MDTLLPQVDSAQIPMTRETELSQAELAQYKQRAIARIAVQNYRKAHKREFFPWSSWYSWQLEGFASSAKQIMTIAGNRTGKTMSAGFHSSCDLTLDYPEDWVGFKQDHAINFLALGVDNQQLRDVVQLELFGNVVEKNGKKRLSGGWVHTDEIGRIEWSPQMSGLARRVEIKSLRGSANCTLRSYTQSKTGQKSLSFAGTSIDLIWVDECPPDDLVGQLVTRTMTGNYHQGGRIRYTMTPELGATNLVTQFMEDRDDVQQLIGPVSWDMCPHLTDDVQRSILAGLPLHEQDMRSKGIPFFGSGLVYPVAENRLKIDPFPIPEHWLVIKAIDLGINHPTAIAWLAYDRDSDTIYVVKTYAVKGENAATHAQSLHTLWPHAKTVFPHDVDTTEKGSGKTVRSYYEEAGVKNTVDFKNSDGSISVEPGIFMINERMRDGRFKVFSNCHEFFRESRLYHRDDGKLVKKNDDVMDATRYGAVMITRYGVPAKGLVKRARRATTGFEVRTGRKRKRNGR
jgi:phage terminase large subunit-like protein